MLAVAPGKRGVFTIDGIGIWVLLEESPPWCISYGALTHPEEPHFASSSETLRRIVAGMETLDKAIETGGVYVRGNLADLLGMHRLVMSILADSPLSRRIFLLWLEFERLWHPVPAAPARLNSLQTQRAAYGRYLSYIPLSVLRTEV
jgi:hypothetical protein